MTVSSSGAKESTTSSTTTKTTTSRKRPNYNEESEEEEFNDDVDDDDDDDDEDFAKEAMSSKKKKIKKEEDNGHTNNNGTSAKKSSSSSSAKSKSVVKKEKKVVPIKKEKSSAKVVKKTSTTKKSNGNNKKVSSKGGGSGSTTTNGGLKAMDKSERISHGMQAYLWWNANDPPKGCQWSKMEHAGVSFPEPYIPHNVQMLYDGKAITLSPIEEEAATFFAAMDPHGMHLGNTKTAPIFIKNFMADFKAILGKNHVIKDYAKCDFGPIRRHLDEQKLVKKAITDGERKTNKTVKDAAMFKFGYALVDGHLEKVGNYNSKYRLL
jgi:DNA topoisomerase-1